MVEFAGYDGSYPRLCSGKLSIKVDGILYEVEDCLISQGSIVKDEDGSYGVTHESWFIWGEMLPDVLLPYLDKIEEIVNENVPYGCCGGCI